MIGKAQAFFNTEIKNNTCLLEKTGNFCFSPVRELFNGRTVHRVDGNYLVENKSTSVIAKIAKVALAVIFLIPGVIAGTFIKTLALLNKKVRVANNELRELSKKPEMQGRLVQEGKKSVDFWGDRANFFPSVASGVKDYPWGILGKIVKNPTALDVSGFQPHHIETLIDTKINWKNVQTLDVSNTEIDYALMQRILAKCPNVKEVKAEGCTNLKNKDIGTIVDKVKSKEEIEKKKEIFSDPKLGSTADLRMPKNVMSQKDLQGIGQRTDLEEIDLSNSKDKLTNKVVDGIVGNRNLKRLALGGIDLPNVQLEKILGSLKALEVLDLSGCILHNSEKGWVDIFAEQQPANLKEIILSGAKVGTFKNNKPLESEAVEGLEQKCQDFKADVKVVF